MKCVWHVCSIILVRIVITSGMQGKSFVFDGGLGGVKSTKETFLDLLVDNHTAPLPSFGVCIRLRLDDLYPQTVFEVPDLKLVMIEGNRNYGHLRLHALDYYIFQYPHPDYLVPEQWYHVCISYKHINADKAILEMVLDGTSLINKEIEIHEALSVLNLSKIWRLGLGKSNILEYGPQTFRGIMSDLNIWSSPLTQDEMKKFASDCQNYGVTPKHFPDILSWSELKIADKGSFVTESSFDWQCNPKCEGDKITAISSSGRVAENCVNDKTLLTFSSKVTFKEAVLTCAQLYGTMPFSKDNEDLHELTTLVNSKILGSSKDRCNSTWMPLYLNGNTNNSTNEGLNFELYDKVLKPLESNNLYLPWQIGQPNGLGYQKCVILTVVGNPLYFDVECKELHCFYCQVPSRLYFNLRGLPEADIENFEEGIDSRYIYIPESQYHEGLVLEGYYDNTIRQNQSNHNWEIIKWVVDTGVIVGVLEDSLRYPFGKHLWRLNFESKSTSIFKDVRKPEKRVLKLTSVRTHKV